MQMSVSLFYFLYYSPIEVMDAGFKLFRDWMLFLSSNVMEEITLNTEALSANT